MHNSNYLNIKRNPANFKNSLKNQVCTQNKYAQNQYAIENHFSESIEHWMMIVKDQYKNNLTLIPVTIFQKAENSSKEEVKVFEEITQIQN